MSRLRHMLVQVVAIVLLLLLLLFTSYAQSFFLWHLFTHTHTQRERERERESNLLLTQCDAFQHNTRPFSDHNKMCAQWELDATSGWLHQLFFIIFHLFVVSCLAQLKIVSQVLLSRFAVGRRKKMQNGNDPRRGAKWGNWAQGSF